MQIEKSKQAVFSLMTYSFKDFSFKYINIENDTFDVDFNPSGRFFKYKEDCLFELNLGFKAFVPNDLPNNSKDNPFIEATLKATYIFNPSISFDEIPEFFYKNSIAIIFPYLRAFIGTLTLQANLPLIMLPTLNLSNLSVPLKLNTLDETNDKK